MTLTFEPEAVARRLRALRIAKGKSVYQMANETGLGRSAITNYERGIRIPRDPVKVTLARYFSRSVGEIFFEA